MESKLERKYAVQNIEQYFEIPENNGVPENKIQGKEGESVILETTPTPHIPLKKARVNQNKNWFFTWNNYPTTAVETLERVFKLYGKGHTFQKEVGENGTPHIQGCVELKKAMRWSEFKLSSSIHWEKTRSDVHASNYCKKSETSKPGSEPYIFGYPKPIKILDENKLYKWEKNIVELFFKEPDGRSLYWFYDKIGGIGKSTFCKFMYVKYKAITIQGGKMTDIMNIIFNINMDEVKMIIIDIPRNNGNMISYSAVECILNGMITNTKYETGIKVFNPPHVVVFCNLEPEINDKNGLPNLSLDRWKITEINNRIIIEEEKVERINYILEL